MQIDSLKYFVEVCRAHSFYGASQKLFISQQGLSKNIAALESELDTKLFERSYNGVELTDDGRILLDYAQRILAEHDDLLGDLFESKHTKTLGGVRMQLGISYYAAQIASSNPDYVKLLSNSAYIELPFDKLVEQARRSDGSDLVFLDVHGPSLGKIADDSDLVFDPVIATYFGIVSREGSPTARAQSLSPADACDLPIAVSAFPEMRRLTNQLFAEHPLSDVRLGSTSPRILIERAQGSLDMVATFDSFGFYLSERDDSMPTSGLAFTPLDSPEALCFVGFLQPRAVRQKARAEHVKKVLRRWLDSHCASYFAQHPTDRLWEEALASRC